jgi:hypothetical protein
MVSSTSNHTARGDMHLLIKCLLHVVQGSHEFAQSTDRIMKFTGSYVRATCLDRASCLLRRANSVKKESERPRFDPKLWPLGCCSLGPNTTPVVYIQSLFRRMEHHRSVVSYSGDPRFNFWPEGWPFCQVRKVLVGITWD